MGTTLVSPEWIPFLRKISLFATFSEEELSHIAKKIVLLALPKSAVLFHAEDLGDCMYIVLSGQVKLLDSIKNKEENEKVIAYFGRGDAIGEMALLAGTTRNYTAKVDSTAEFMVLFKKDLDGLIEEFPSMAIHISRYLSQRLADPYRQDTKPVQPSEIHVVFAPVSPSVRTTFAISLGVSLIEQTRKKVLLLDIDNLPGTFAKALGLEPIRVTEGNIHAEDVQKPEFVKMLTSSHTSGLEILTMAPELLKGKLFEAIYPLLAVLRQLYSHVLIVLPHLDWTAFRPIIDEADTVIAVCDAGTRDTAYKQIYTLTSSQPGSKVRYAWLHPENAESTPPQHIKNAAKIPWNGNFTDTCPPLTLRYISRLSRTLGHLRLGLAMGSGAAYGYVIIGILKVLEREGIFPDVITGTSMGAIIGAFYAKGLSPKEIEEVALTITKLRLWRMADPTLPRSGLLIGRGVMRFLKSVLGDRTFDELSTPFACVATDIVTGEEIVLKEGVVAEAVRASMSLPFFFQPHFYRNRFLVDGGIVNPVPTATLALLGADLLVSTNLTTKPSQKRVPFIRKSTNWPMEFQGPNLFEVLIKMIYTMQHEIACARSEIAHVSLLADTSDFTWIEFHRAAEIIKKGEACAEEAIPKIKALLPYFKDR